MSVDRSSLRLNLTRDEVFDEFTLQTFRDRYLIPGETSPQEAFARASAAFADDEAHAQRLYDYVSQGWFMFATPLLSNGGTDRGLPISCFLTTAEDSRAGIFDHWAETGWLSSVGGGVGGYWGGLRSNGAKTSKGSASTGVVPFIATVDRLILSVSQGGTRRGSYAAYLDISHPEVVEFITGRKPTGGDENRKFTNLHNAVCITDEFMRAVGDEGTFDLVDPKTKAVTETVDARALWRLIIETRKQTGEPYLFFVDHANAALPETQKAKGLRVNQSNLCVTPQTEILTRDGYAPIGALKGQQVEVWNGEDWSVTTVEQTGTAQELVRVWFEDGSHLDCTPHHKFYTTEGLKRAGELTPGLRLEPANHPTVVNPNDAAHSIDTAYTAGYATFTGFEDKNRLSVFARETDVGVLKRLLSVSVDSQADTVAEGLYIRFEPQTIPSGRAPLRWSQEARLAWFAGVMDAAGEWIELDQADATGFRDYLSVATTDADLVREMRLAALEAGLTPRVRITDTGAGFMLNVYDVHRLANKGLLVKQESRLPEDHIGKLTPLPVVVDVQPLAWKSDTFCFTESQRSRGVFNGLLTGNCTEITLATGRDDTGAKRTAVCCLSSVNGEKYPEWSAVPEFIPDLMRMLDNCLEVFINDAPPELAYAVYSATQERSVGLGLLGFHALLQRKMIAFESNAAREINKLIFRHIRADADQASLVLGAERGEAPDMAGTGERFAHKLAIAPNASSSILCGNTSPSVEPWRANAYLQKTLSGSFAVKNPFLIRELRKRNLDTAEVWKAIVADEGSIQNLGVRIEKLGEPAVYDIFGTFVDADDWDHVRAVFKTFTELDMRWVVQHARDRQGEIDQAQSINLAFPHDADAGYATEVHYMAWDPDGEGAPLKSLYYYRSTTPRRAENTNSKVERKVIEAYEAPPSNGLSANPLDDSTCIACEG
ncbi:ribonucleoside-diphosphate reductase I subunit alpha [Brevundimonas phage vB_BpoS-Kabachok]|uniref:Ribonucleoside-diphosphate reductase n=1 Tax=Brevundimonas phage vB_BpoS-Kabachok TaxID=2948600 RepID=A0A9E7MQC4_9CAUD|nr:ribonucleoside-diphosphate reductase I subunit alpha [Brevundimonas phage vB_BpoS-Kabachok]